MPCCGVIFPLLLVLCNENIFIFFQGGIFWVTPLCWSALTMLWNVGMDSYMIFYSLWNLTFLFLLSPRTLFLSWVMSLSIIVCYAKYFRRIYNSVKNPQNCLKMWWGWWGPGTNPLPSILGMVYMPLLPYPMTISTLTVLSTFIGLWHHLLQLASFPWPYHSLLFT